MMGSVECSIRAVVSHGTVRIVMARNPVGPCSRK